MATKKQGGEEPVARKRATKAKTTRDSADEVVQSAASEDVEIPAAASASGDGAEPAHADAAPASDARPARKAKRTPAKKSAVAEASASSSALDGAAGSDAATRSILSWPSSFAEMRGREDRAVTAGHGAAPHRAPAAPATAPALPAMIGPEFPDTEYAVVEKLLVNFLAGEVRKVGLERAVLGLSGGVDSAVSAAIAARALGAENVLGIMMPYQSSSPESLADAYEVAEALGIETLVVEITAQVDAYFERFPDASRLRRGNKMARERMTILYDHSAARSALVIGTSNKTELLLGYGTLYGDMASALNPIGDLYKTQVWGLARQLGLPASVIEKAPTADLWSGQTDEHELGFSYHQVDRLLYRLIDERCSVAELVDMGFDAAFVERISRMVRASQFKRRLPIIAKISARSIDTDFRYSRDWGL